MPSSTGTVAATVEARPIPLRQWIAMLVPSVRWERRWAAGAALAALPGFVTVGDR